MKQSTIPWSFGAISACAFGRLDALDLETRDPNNSDMIAAATLKMQKGNYSMVGMPSVPDMIAQREFHGTSSDVTVPASAAGRDRFCGLADDTNCRPIVGAIVSSTNRLRH